MARNDGRPRGVKVMTTDPNPYITASGMRYPTRASAARMGDFAFSPRSVYIQEEKVYLRMNRESLED